MVKHLKILAWALVAALVQAGIAWTSDAYKFFYGPVGPTSMFDDVHIYYTYASRVVDGGLVPYRDFDVEYPVAAFPFFVLPRLFAAHFAEYKRAFGAEVLLFNALAVYLVALRVGRVEGLRRVPGRLGWYTLVFAGFCPLLLTRFDLIPMAVAFASSLAWSRGPSAAGGALSGLGTLVKIFPGVIAAPALARDLTAPGREPKRRLRGLIGLAAAMGLGVAGWLALGGGGVRRSLQYHLERGLEIGSLYSGIVMLLGRATGAPIRIDHNHSSMETLSPWSPGMAGLALPLQLAALGLVMARAARRSRPGGDFVRDAAAAVAGFIAFGKILSPQYLAWLFPFVAAVGGWTGVAARALLLAACAATTLVYPWGFHQLMALYGAAAWLLNARNALLVVLWLVLLSGPGAPSLPKGPSRPAD